MTVELEFVRHRPGGGAAVASAYADAITQRGAPAPLLGYWTVDVGHLNVAALLWSFADPAAHRAARASSTMTRPSSLEAVVESTDSLVLEPAPFNGALEPGAYGGVYEMRIYDYKIDSLDSVIERWSELIDARRVLSPLIGCFSASDGLVVKWVHIWAYRDEGERQRIRADAMRSGSWPPATREFLVRQENMIVVPSEFSPLH